MTTYKHIQIGYLMLVITLDRAGALRMGSNYGQG